MAESDNREQQPVMETGFEETQPTYQRNVKITVGAESTDTITVTVAVRDMNHDLEEITPLEFFITSTATAAAGTITAVDSESFTSGTEIQEILNHAHYKVLTDTSGDFVAALTKSGDLDVYMGVIYDGHLFMSGIIAFTT